MSGLLGEVLLPVGIRVRIIVAQVWLAVCAPLSLAHWQTCRLLSQGFSLVVSAFACLPSPHPTPLAQVNPGEVEPLWS